MGAVIGGVIGGLGLCGVLLFIGVLLYRRFFGTGSGWKKEILSDTPLSNKHEEIKVPPMAEEMDETKKSFDNPIYDGVVVYEKDKVDSSGDASVTLSVRDDDETDA